MRMTLIGVLAALPVIAQAFPVLPEQKPPPPAIQRLLDKQDAGEELTDAEAKACDDWQEQAAQDMQRSFLGAVRASPQGVAALAAGGVAGSCPQRADGSVSAAPGRAGWVKLLDELSRDYRKKLGEGADALDRQLAKAKGDEAGSNAALPLSMAGGAHAAVYVTLWSCRRKPDAALFASNLGSLLDGVGDERAGQALAYAVALAPGTVLPNVNLGWLHFHRGDLGRAKASFGAAAKKAPGSAAVLLGQGMVAHCEGDHRRAVELLSRAISQRSSAAGEGALDESQAKLAEEPAASPDAIPVPRREDRTRTARPGRVSIADPFVPGTNQLAVTEGFAKNGAIVEGYAARTKVLLEKQQGLEPNAGRDRPPARTATSITVYRSDDAMAALARAQYTAYAEKVRAVRAPFERDFDRQRERVSTLVQDLEKEALAGDPALFLAVFCKKLTPAMEREYSQFRAIWRGTWEAERKLIREYGEAAGATISQIRHDDLRKYVDVERQLHVITWGQDGPADVIGWGTLGGAIRVCGAPSPPPPPGVVDASDDANKAPCPPFLQNGFGFNCGIASVSLDCEKIAFQGGEGIIGRFEQNYVKHEQTFYLGVGVSATAGAGPLNAGVEGSAGAFITTGGGEFRDFGYTASASSVAGPLSMEAGVTVGAISGPSTSSSATLNVGPASFGID